MSIITVFAATHDSGARYTPFKGELKVGQSIHIVGRLDSMYVDNNRPNQGCVRLEDVDGHDSLKWGKNSYSTTDICGYNKSRKASEGRYLFVATVVAQEAHIATGISISARCVHPVSGETQHVYIPVKSE